MTGVLGSGVSSPPQFSPSLTPRAPADLREAPTTWIDPSFGGEAAPDLAPREHAGVPLGDRDFSTAMTAVLPDLRLYAVALAGSGVEGDDLLQDALVRIWRYRASFQQDASLRGWMFSVLRNEFRTQRGRRRPGVEDIDGELSGALSCGPAQEWSVQWREVLAALASLPRPNRQALIVVVGLGCTYAEAAAICACDLRTLKGRVHRARARLAQLTGWESLLKGRSQRATAGPAVGGQTGGGGNGHSMVNEVLTKDRSDSPHSPKVVIGKNRRT